MPKPINNSINQSCKELSCKLGVSEFLAELLHSRGITNSREAMEFLDPSLENLSSPYVFKNMDAAVKRINLAIKNDEKILIYGDYDCDGVGAIAILFLCFKEINKLVDYYIPSRANEGYGITLDAIDIIKKQYNPDLIITVDCGATSVKEVEYILSNGIDIIVTDHHLCANELPNCLMLNPCISEDVTPLCGAGMAFMLCRAVFGEIANKFIDICAISTIADIVPLIKDNRIIAKCGIEAINNGKCRRGIKELSALSGVKLKNIDCFDIGYKIAPRINSSGRLDTAYDSLSLLIEDDNTSVILLAEQLNLQNLARQNLNKTILDEAMEILKSYDFGNRRIIVIYNKDWQEGIIGIVAAKIAEFFNLPTIILTDAQNGDLKGSARSIAGINLSDMLERSCKHLKTYGGHAMAAGMSLDKANLAVFVENINSDIINNHNKNIFKRVDKFDMQLSLNSIKPKHLQELRLLEPFGHKNRKPIFCDSNFSANFNQIASSDHIKSRIPRGDILNFNGIDYLELLNAPINKKITYTIGKNYFRGRESNQFLVKKVFVEKLILPEDEILCRMLKTAINLKINKLPKKINNCNKPRLYVAYSTESFNKMLNIYPEMEVALYKLKRFCIEDTLAFCPDEKFPYYYYNQITLLDSLPCKLVDFFASFAPIKFNILQVQNRVIIDKNSLRDDFIFIKAALKVDASVEDMDRLYNRMVNYGYQKSKLSFYLSFSIFVDVELLKIEKSVIILSNYKVNIEDSSIYQFFIKTME